MLKRTASVDNYPIALMETTRLDDHATLPLLLCLYATVSDTIALVYLSVLLQFKRMLFPSVTLFQYDMFILFSRVKFL